MSDSANAQIGAGVSLGYADDLESPIEYTPLANIRSIQGVGSMKPEVESTTLDSLAVERIKGLADGKEVTIVLTTTSAGKTLIEGWYASVDPIHLRLSWPAPSSITRYFDLTVLDIDDGTITPSGLCEQTVKGRITGPITSVAPAAEV